MNRALVEQLRGSATIVMYGASSSGVRGFYNLEQFVEPDKIVFYDSNPAKQGTSLLGRPILTAAQFQALDKNTPILITSTMHYEITPRLQEMGFTNTHFDHAMIFSEKKFEKFDEGFREILASLRQSSHMTDDELYTLYHSSKAVGGVPGAIAEIGVYKGGSAYLLAKLAGARNIYLFDTFAGLPAKAVQAATVKGTEPTAGWLSDTDAQTVARFVQSSGIAAGQVHMRVGFFPDTATDISDTSFALVHLDTDLYRTTLDALEYFYPRIPKGGRIVSHDYNSSGTPGVKQAFQEFFGAKGLAAHIVEISESQVLVVKC